MTSSDFTEKLSSVLDEAVGPTIRGKIISETNDTLVLRAEDAIIEIGQGHVVSRSGGNDPGAEIELRLADDANLLVSTIVSVKHGFVGDNVFGPLSPGILADNCNCNCNCSSLPETVSTAALMQLRRPFNQEEVVDNPYGR